ncbi:hypothetical protein FDECE_7729 [Fusarium decemcellulare]|nr:hypothetical protein FDECE_7729 [Fusarium decemcellulare]
MAQKSGRLNNQYSKFDTYIDVQFGEVDVFYASKRLSRSCIRLCATDQARSRRWLQKISLLTFSPKTRGQKLALREEQTRLDEPQPRWQDTAMSSMSPTMQRLRTFHDDGNVISHLGHSVERPLHPTSSTSNRHESYSIGLLNPTRLPPPPAPDLPPAIPSTSTPSHLFRLQHCLHKHTIAGHIIYGASPLDESRQSTSDSRRANLRSRATCWRVLAQGKTWRSPILSTFSCFNSSFIWNDTNTG